MKKPIQLAMFTLLALPLFLGAFPASYAQAADSKGVLESKPSAPPSMSKHGMKRAAQGPKKTPPGWSKGKKTGWKGSGTPPGLEKKKAPVQQEAAVNTHSESEPNS